MLTIHKYRIDIIDAFTIAMPAFARILKIDTQQNQPYMWVEVNTEHPIVTESFYIFGTGHEIADKKAEYIDTFQLGGFVGHVYRKEVN